MRIIKFLNSKKLIIKLKNNFYNKWTKEKLN